MKKKPISNTQALTRASLVTGLYIALTLVVAPLAFGPFQIRISEGLNYTALYNKRYVFAVSLGVFIVNIYQFGVIDILIGGAHTLVSLVLARWLGDLVTKKIKNERLKMTVKYLVLALIISVLMFMIAWILLLVGAEAAFWPVYFSLFLSQLVVMAVTGIFMFAVAQVVNFYE